MAKKQYQGVDGIAREVKKRYQGVNGVAREVKKAYTGVSGVARQYFNSNIIEKDGVEYEYKYVDIGTSNTFTTTTDSGVAIRVMHNFSQNLSNIVWAELTISLVSCVGIWDSNGESSGDIVQTLPTGKTAIITDINISKETEIDSLFFFVNNSQYENTGKGSRCSISTSISPNQIIITESDSGYGDWGGILRQPTYELSWEIYYK